MSNFAVVVEQGQARDISHDEWLAYRGPGFAWLLAAPEIKAHKRWFWEFLVVAMVLYTEFKNVINRVSQIKEF